MKVIVSLIFVLILIALGSTNPIDPWENNQCYQEKKREIEAAGGYRQTRNEVNAARIRNVEHFAVIFCASPEEQIEFASDVFIGERENEVEENLPCFKAALKSLKPESSLVDGAQCDDWKVKKLIETVTVGYKNSAGEIFKFDDMNITSCTLEELVPKDLFLIFGFGQQILKHSDFDDERYREEAMKLLEEFLLLHESMYNCILKQFKQQ